jgi:predicted O-methyltransferase YrrM
MKRLPALEIDFSELNNLYFGTIASRLLMTAVGIKIFDHLEEAVSSEKVALVLKSHPENTGLMLDALCAGGLLEKKEGLYRNGRLANDFLVCGKPAYLGEWLRQADEVTQPFLEKLEDYIRSGPEPPPEEQNMNGEAYCESFTASHAASSLAGIARQFASHISELPGFQGCRTLLDLGGGPGINAMAVTEKNPDLKATVFDRPGIVRMAQNYIREYGFEDRVSTIGGDYLKDPLGTGYDLVMSTDSLYYGDDEIDPVLKRCRDSIRPGGIFVGIHAVLTHERTRSVHLVMALLAETMTGQAHLREEGFLLHALDRCGFRRITSKMVTICGIPMEMNAGYV